MFLQNIGIFLRRFGLVAQKPLNTSAVCFPRNVAAHQTARCHQQMTKLSRLWREKFTAHRFESLVYSTFDGTDDDDDNNNRKQSSCTPTHCYRLLL